MAGEEGKTLFQSRKGRLHVQRPCSRIESIDHLRKNKRRKPVRLGCREKWGVLGGEAEGTLMVRGYRGL